MKRIKDKLDGHTYYEKNNKCQDENDQHVFKIIMIDVSYYCSNSSCKKHYKCRYPLGIHC